MNEQIELYELEFRTNYEGYINVPMWPYVREETRPFEPKDFIDSALQKKAEGKEFPKDMTLTEDYLKELFTYDEAEAFCQYMRENYEIDVTKKLIETPIENYKIPICYMTFGGPRGVLCLKELDEYDLPFRADIFYDLEGADKTLERQASDIARDVERRLVHLPEKSRPIVLKRVIAMLQEKKTSEVEK